MDVLPKILTLVSVSLLVKQIFTLLKKLQKKNFIDREINDVLIFYEDYKNCGKPVDDNCTDQTCAEHSFHKIIARLNAAQISIDLCVYVISCRNISDALIKAYKRGVSIRLVLDMEGIPASRRLYLAGIPIRCKRSENIMHHKFCVIDGVSRQAELDVANKADGKKMLPEHKDGFVMFGSMNWTSQSTTGNYESLVLTNDAALVLQFERIFFGLWDDFEPEPTHPSEVPIDLWNETGY